VGGQQFSLRARAKNFDIEELLQAVQYAHSLKRKIYVTVNIFAKNEDFKPLYDYFIKLRAIGVDAVIVSDPGVISLVREIVPDLETHVSTQANTNNYRAANFWKKTGVKRVILARELSFKEIAEIHEKEPDIALECFVHGAMCIAYSGRCLLSQYMTGRASNRGECAHPCRYKYNLMEETRQGEYMPIEEDGRGTYIMNSKDLCMIEYLPEFIKAGVTGLKIEGRQKSVYYTAVVTRTYRAALDDYFIDPDKYEKNRQLYLNELLLTGSRDFTTGFYTGATTAEAQIYGQDKKSPGADFCGIVKSYDPETKFAVIEQRGKFSVGDKLEFFTSFGKDFNQTITNMYDLNTNAIESAPHPRQLVKIRTDHRVGEMDILRRRK
jgi:putative protease